MAKNRRIEVSMTRTVNLGNYESVRFQAGLSQDISDDIELDDAYEELWDTVIGQVEDMCSDLGEELKSKNRPKRLR